MVLRAAELYGGADLLNKAEPFNENSILRAISPRGRQKGRAVVAAVCLFLLTAAAAGAAEPVGEKNAEKPVAVKKGAPPKSVAGKSAKVGEGKNQATSASTSLPQTRDRKRTTPSPQVGKGKSRGASSATTGVATLNVPVARVGKVKRATPSPQAGKDSISPRPRAGEGLGERAQTTAAQQLGQNARVFPNRLVFKLLADGFAAVGPDGQYFFDSDHPVALKSGTVSVSNTGGGSGAAWYLLDTTKVVKPIIYQQRTPFKPQELTSDNSDHVFKRNELLFGVDGRCNVGYGLWQTAYASKQTLTDTALWAARAGMMAIKGDNGEPLGITPNLLLVPPALEQAARTALEAVIISNTTNVMKGLMKVEVCPWLA